MKKENTRNQEELVLEDALTQIIFNEKEEQDMVEDDNAEEIDDEDYEVEEDNEDDDEDDRFQKEDGFLLCLSSYRIAGSKAYSYANRLKHLF